MQRASAFDCALRVLALRDHSEAELRRKLKAKGYDEPEVTESVTRLQELGYLDDTRFARCFAESSIRNGRGYGARLRQELARRGVAGAIVQETLAELSEEFEETGVLASTMERRYPGFVPAAATDKEIRRIVAYLQRKGFTLGAILAALKTNSI